MRQGGQRHQGTPRMGAQVADQMAMGAADDAAVALLDALLDAIEADTYAE